MLSADVPRPLPLLASLLALSASAALAAVPGSAGAADPIGETWPAYAGNELRVQVPGGRLVAGSVQRVRLSGRAFWKRPDDTTEYTLLVYLQDADVDAHCSTSVSAQRQKSINLGSLNASNTIDGWVVDEDLRINRPDDGRDAIDWAGESTPFTVRPGVRRVVLCAYQRYIIDDVAYSEAAAKIEQPRCRVPAANVRRGRALAVRCNVHGRLDARFSSGARSRRIAVRIDRNGRARLPTGALAPGRWNVRFSSADVRLGSDRVRVR